MTDKSISGPAELAVSQSPSVYGTAGEQLLGRELDKELRAGVEHYVPGQHQATIFKAREWPTDDPCEVGRVTYVDQMGHACVVLTFRKPGEDWRATWVGRAGQTWKEEARKVEGFKLSEKMLAALAVAKVEPIPTPDALTRSGGRQPEATPPSSSEVAGGGRHL